MREDFKGFFNSFYGYPLGNCFAKMRSFDRKETENKEKGLLKRDSGYGYLLQTPSTIRLLAYIV